MELDSRHGSGGPGGDASPEALVGTLLANRYRLDAVLGAGGMGAVYLATDETLQRQVAVKVVRAGLAADPKLIERFLREARSAAALAHPTLVTVHDTGWHQQLPFLVMERLNGESLADRLKRGRLAPQVAVRLMARALEGLAAAHAAGIVHRDLKPANLFLCAPDDAPKILDFGIAAAQRPGPGAERLTDAGNGVGTPLYAPPEQLRGAAPDPRADVYSVGAVLYEALSGQLLFHAQTLPELYAKKLTEEPISLGSIAPHLPPALTAVIEQALGRDPANRFASARALRTALLEAVSLEPDQAIPPTRVPPARSAPAASATLPTPVRGELAPPPPTVPAPRRWRALGVGLVVAIAIAVGARAMWPAPIAPIVRPEPTAPRAPAVGLRQLARQHDGSGSTRALLGDVDGWEVARVDFEHASGQPGAPAHWLAAARLCAAQVALLRGQLEAAASGFAAILAVEPDWAAAHLGLAAARFRQSRTDDAVAELRRAEQADPNWWVPISAAASMYASTGAEDRALDEYRRALALAPGEPAILDEYALTLHAARMDDQATRLAEEALRKDPDLIWSHVLLAERALEKRNGPLALSEATRAVSISPTTPAAQLARADALVLLHRDDEAKDVYHHVVEIAGETNQRGLPAGRLALVTRALFSGKLPAPRAGATTKRSVPAPPRSTPHKASFDDLF